MKINLGKLLRLAGRLIVAAPAIVDAIRPVVAKRQNPQAPQEPAPERVPDLPAAERIGPS